MLDMATLVNGSVSALRNSAWFPYDTGNLKYNATYGDMHLSSFGVGIIKFDTTRAPYIFFLENGTGLYGKYKSVWQRDFKYKSAIMLGSGKHKDFISDKSVNAVIDYICRVTGGDLWDLRNVSSEFSFSNYNFDETFIQTSILS